MDQILSALDSYFDTVMDMVGTVVTTITGNPLLLLFAISGFVGIGIGIVKRLCNVN